MESTTNTATPPASASADTWEARLHDLDGDVAQDGPCAARGVDVVDLDQRVA
jgi:hypothetical protein